MSIVLKLQKLSVTAIHSEMNLELVSNASIICPPTGVGGIGQFEME
jgi:hypothetical protein